MGIGGQHGRRFVLLRHTHRPQRRQHCGTKQERSILQLNAPGLRWLFATLMLQHPNQSQQAARSATRDVSFLRSDSRCRRYVRDLSNVTPRYLGSEQKGRVSLLMLTFSSRLDSLLLTCNTADTIFLMLSFSFQVWRYSPSVSMALLSAPSTACQSPLACIIARSQGCAYSLEMVVGMSEM